VLICLLLSCKHTQYLCRPQSSRVLDLHSRFIENNPIIQSSEMDNIVMEEFASLKFRQLDIAQSSTLLIYTRDRSDHGLAKKLRPEFQKLSITSEVRDCQKLFKRITNDTKDEFPIDVVRYLVMHISYAAFSPGNSMLRC
jgi:hypothetical protein